MLKDAISIRPAAASASAMVLLCAGLAGCALHWPWRHRAPAAPQPVQELSIQAPATAAVAEPAQIAQFWDRNSLLLDLTAVRGDGAVILKPAATRGWPIRLEFRVLPGSIAQLEVQGRERIVFQVPGQGAPVVLKLAPDAYVRDTAQIIVRWNAAGDSAR